VISASGLLVVDKPAGWTSHDVVAQVRCLAGTRRVGHAGTLDPMATGILVIGVGRATRLLGYLALTEKEYLATIRLGQATDTGDAEGRVTASADASATAASAVQAAAAALTGEIQQVPPAVSAIKVAGQRAYRLARAGAPPDLAARAVTVREFRVLDCRPAGSLLDVDVAVRCSSGTYVRSLARDLGEALGVGGHLTMLRRTRVGPYGLGLARTLDELARELSIVPLEEAAAAAFPCWRLSAKDARVLAHGGRLPAAGFLPLPDLGQRAEPDQPAGPGMPAGLAQPAGPGQGDRSSLPVPGPVAAFGPDGRLVALVEQRAGTIRPLTVFAP
jgi:tRNA pseudouridine55 synthase